MIIVRLLSPGPWLVGTTKAYSGVGADIVMESITLTTRFGDVNLAFESHCFVNSVGLANAGIPNAPAGGTIRATEAVSTTEQPRKAAKSARWDGLTFDTEGEIIISSSGSQL